MNTKKTWVPRLATLHKIYGVDSYTVPIYDADSRYVGLSIVKANGDNRSVAYGTTKEEAFEAYKMLLAKNGSGDDVTADTKKEIKNMSGTVKRIAQKNENLWLVLLNEDTHFFAVEGSDELVLTKEGDKVNIEYFVIDDQTLPVSKFDNDNL
jgi:Cu/Ag efflux protein CusF